MNNQWHCGLLARYHTDTYHQDWGGEASAGLYYYTLRQAQTNSSYQGWLEVIR